MTTDCSWNYHENCKRRTWAEHVQPMNNLLSYCGLVEATISVSEKDLPIPTNHFKDLRSNRSHICVLPDY